jgi:integrase
MHDRIIGALETCCRQGEMLRIQNRHVDWERQQIAIPATNAKDRENRRIPFEPDGRLAPILKRRAELGPSAFVFGTAGGAFQAKFKSAWESLLLIANGFEPTRAKPGGSLDRAKLHQIDLHWHDLRHHAEPWIMPTHHWKGGVGPGGSRDFVRASRGIITGLQERPAAGHSACSGKV